MTQLERWGDEGFILFHMGVFKEFEVMVYNYGIVVKNERRHELENRSDPTAKFRDFPDGKRARPIWRF